MFKRFFFLISIAFIICACQHQFIKTIYDFKYSPPKPIEKKIRVALVLGGGGARAISQIGAIEVLKKHNIPIDLIIGTSAGSIIGALYAGTEDVGFVKKIVLNVRQKDLIKVSLKDAVEGATSLRGGLDGSTSEDLIRKNLDVEDFNHLKIPFIAIATDLISGKTIELKSGSLAPAIRASCAIPGLFSPVKIYDMILVDGGVTAPLAVEVAKKYNPDVIIAIDIRSSLKDPKINNMIDVAYRSLYISYEALNDFNSKLADVVIRPSLDDVGLFEDGKNLEIYLAGKAAAEKAMPEILSVLKKRSINIKNVNNTNSQI
ncbi:MAG: patatin-like phospholipase family protein [Rickettsiaceae bacterium]|nr:patatin-like phospholipase family protein [Rickettsiaceae bacterium]